VLPLARTCTEGRIRIARPLPRLNYTDVTLQPDDVLLRQIQTMCFVPLRREQFHSHRFLKRLDLLPLGDQENVLRAEPRCGRKTCLQRRSLAVRVVARSY